MFKTNFTGHDKIWRGTAKFGGRCLHVATCLARLTDDYVVWTILLQLYTRTQHMARHEKTNLAWWRNLLPTAKRVVYW